MRACAVCNEKRPPEELFWAGHQREWVICRPGVNPGCFTRLGNRRPNGGSIPVGAFPYGALVPDPPYKRFAERYPIRPSDPEWFALTGRSYDEEEVA